MVTYINFSGVRVQCNDGLLSLHTVLQKHLKLPSGKFDIFVNVVGGMRLREPASDLAVAMAVMSSYYERPVLPRTAFVGEIGLGGEVRGVQALDRRISEADKLGFKRLVVFCTPERS